MWGSRWNCLFVSILGMFLFACSVSANEIGTADLNAVDNDRNIIRQANGSIMLDRYDVVTITKAFKKNPNVAINFDVGFARNSTVLTADGRSVVDILARVMFHIGKDYQFHLTGYADINGSRDFKKRLSKNRAQIMTILLKNNHGVPNELTFSGSTGAQVISSNGIVSGPSSDNYITITNKGTSQ